MFFLLLALPLMSCSPDDNNNAAAAPAPYEQYGTPFNQMPDRLDAVIYQVNVRSFSDEGTLNAVTQRLDYIKDLGANVVYLMPIYPIGQVNMAGAKGSPYSISDYKAIAPSMGTMADLRALVDAAHSKGMAVILDWVANHTAWDSAWITQHPEYYQKDADGNIISPPGTNWADVAQLEFNNTGLRAAMIDAMSYWVYNANIDGFRCDAADYVQQSFWTEANASLRAIKNQPILMLAEGSRANHFNSGFDYIFGFNFFDALRQVYHEGQPATYLQTSNAIEYANNLNPTQRVVRYTTNHDVNLSEGTALQVFNGNAGSMAAFVVAAYLKSIPMVYNAQEIGYNQRIDFLNDNPIDWSSPNNAMLEEYKKLIAFRKSSDAIKRGNYNGYSTNAVSAFTMEYNGEKVLVLSNLTNANVNYIAAPALTATAWKDAFTDAAAPLAGNITLQPYQYIVLKNY